MNKFAWDIMKRELTKGERAGSTGYQAQVYKAALTFGAISHLLKSAHKEVVRFNNDAEATDALLNSGFLKQIGVIKE